MSIASRSSVSLAVWIAAVGLCTVPTDIVAQQGEEEPRQPSRHPRVHKIQTREGAPVIRRAGRSTLPRRSGSEQKEPVLAEGTKRPNSYFDVTELDLGTYLEGERARGRFPFANETEETVEFRAFNSSCTCAHAKIVVGDRQFELRDTPAKNTIHEIRHGEDDSLGQARIVESIPIEPGAEGYVDVETDLRNVRGEKKAFLTFQTTNRRLPAVRLDWTAKSADYFTLSPSEVNLNYMRWDEQRDFTVRVTSPMQADFEILGHSELPEHLDLDYRKVEENGRSAWIIEGTYGPGVSSDAAGGIVEFETDIDGKKFPLRVIAWVKGPLEVKPGSFLQFGRVPASEGKTVSVELQPNDGFDLQVEKIEVLRSKIPDEYFEITHRKDGETLILDVTIKPGVRRGLAFGQFQVDLNHPGVEPQRFQFNGFVRR